MKITHSAAPEMASPYRYLNVRFIDIISTKMMSWTTIYESDYDGFSCTKRSVTRALYVFVAVSRGQRCVSGGPGIKKMEKQA